MEIRQIQYFLSIVNTGSFSQAADEHYIGQSSLSKMIIALEKELGVSLFDRSKRKIVLTEAGEVFLEHARKINADYKTMLAEMDGYKSTADYFSIGTIPVLSEYGIIASIAQFRDQYPEIHLNLEEIDGLNILPALDEHRFDVAFTRHNYVDTDHFTSLVISRDKFLVAVSRKNPLAERSSISLRELSNSNFIVFDKVTELNRLIMDECQKAGFEPTIFYSSHQKVSVLGLVGTNIGVALIPSIIYDFHEQPEVHAIPMEENIECNIVLVYPRNRPLSKAATTFVDFMKDTAANK